MLDSRIRIGRVGPSRSMTTVTDVARELRLTEQDVRTMLEILEQQMHNQGLKQQPDLPSVPIIRFGNQDWLDLHALELALGYVMDPQTDPADWPTVAKVYGGLTRAEIEKRLAETGHALFKPIRKKRQTANRQQAWRQRQQAKHRQTGPGG